MKEREQAIEILKEDRMFNQLAKEIVFFCTNGNKSAQKMNDFVLYELHLRCVDKNVLGKLAEQNEPDEGNKIV